MKYPSSAANTAGKTIDSTMASVDSPRLTAVTAYV
jgi:hypothetical protein